MTNPAGRAASSTASAATNQVFFGPFRVTPHVFHQTSLSFAIVNLKPLLAGHVLVSPVRRVPRLLSMTSAELEDFWATVRRVATMIERVFKADGMNVAVQDGPAAGQSVPHVHCHLIPRHSGDLDLKGGSDQLYRMLNESEGDVGFHWRQYESVRELGSRQFDDKQSDRPARSDHDLVEEAEWLRSEMEHDARAEMAKV